MGRKRVLIPLVLLALPLWAQDTGWRNPQADYGGFNFGWRAYYNDNQSAIVSSPSAVIFHDYWSYGISLPPGAQVRGIEVRLDAWHSGSGRESYLWVELSGDGGASWTSTGYGTGGLPSKESTYVLGGPADLWGRNSWLPPELSGANFRVRVFGTGTARLDWVAVRVHYSTDLSLEVDPRTVDLGSLSLTDYDRGYLQRLEAQVVGVTSSATWTLYIAATRDTWSYTGELPDPQKPCEHLLWRVEYAEGAVSSVEKEFTPISSGERIVAQGSAGTAKLSLSFELLVDYDTTWPGTYSLEIRYTLVAP